MNKLLTVSQKIYHLLSEDLIHVDAVKATMGAYLETDAAKDAGIEGDARTMDAVSRVAASINNRDTVMRNMRHLILILHNRDMSTADIVHNNLDQMDINKLARFICRTDMDVYPTDEPDKWVHIVDGIATGKLSARELFNECASAFEGEHNPIIDYALGYCVK